MLACLKDLPRVLKIGPYDWEVAIYNEELGDKCGEADFETHEIVLWSANLTSPSHVCGIVLHECLHVIFDNEKLVKLKKNKEAREEQIVRGFEAGLVSLFRDNPKFLNWLRKYL